ncbi:MAG: protein kinase [Gemmatimonadota bacterium]
MTTIIERLRSGVTGRYEIERELGRGGMATVFLATDLKHKRQVAIKVLDPELASAIGSSRFLREIEIVARLTHPHVLPIHDSGTADDLLYYVMPYVEGETLRDRLARSRQLPVDDALRIVRDVAEALEYAHTRGVIHRDIKPENILLAGRDAFVADFGIARAVECATDQQARTATGIMLGTPQYMSPEQASGEREIDGRSDVYALGCVLYEMLAGEAPFSGPTVQSVMVKHLTATAPPVRALRPSVSAGVESVINRALAKSPADRYQDAGALIRALDAVGSEGSARQPAMTGRGFALAGVGAMVVGLGLWLVFSQSDAGTTPDPVSRSPSLAVLPFDQIGAGQDSLYFADGLTEELIAAVGRIPGLRVISRTSAFAFRDKRGLTLSQIADSLGVGMVLEGSVQRESNRLRVIARLIDVAADSTLLNRDFNREVRDVFALQNEIAQEIAGALRLRLGGSASTPSAAALTHDVEAYDLYLQGRAFWNQRTPAALNTAVARFQAAIARDSNFAAAHVGLSDALTLSALRGGASPDELRTRAVAAAERALQIDSSNAGAHAALGHALFNFYHDYKAGEKHLTRALALDSSAARLFLGILYNDMGQPDRGIALLRQAIEQDPFSAAVRTTLARFYITVRRFPEALEQLRISVALSPNWSLTHVLTGYALVEQGNRTEGVAAFQRGAALGNTQDSAFWAYGLAVTGQRDAAERVLRAVVRDRSEIFSLDAIIALAYVGLGNHEEAFRWLDRQVRGAGSPAFIRLPAFDPIRNDPRFVRLLRDLGVTP